MAKRKGKTNQDELDRARYRIRERNGVDLANPDLGPSPHVASSTRAPGSKSVSGLVRSVQQLRDHRIAIGERALNAGHSVRAAMSYAVAGARGDERVEAMVRADVMPALVENRLEALGTLARSHVNVRTRAGYTVFGVRGAGRRLTFASLDARPSMILRAVARNQPSGSRDRANYMAAARRLERRGR